MNLKTEKVNEIIWGFFYGTHKVDNNLSRLERQKIQAIKIRNETRESPPYTKR